MDTPAAAGVMDTAGLCLHGGKVSMQTEQPAVCSSCCCWSSRYATGQSSCQSPLTAPQMQVESSAATQMMQACQSAHPHPPYQQSMHHQYTASPSCRLQPAAWVWVWRSLDSRFMHSSCCCCCCSQINSNTCRRRLDTHHITNGGDVSDSHLVHSVPLAVIPMK